MPSRTVHACSDCGEETTAGTAECPTCGGEVERVDPLLVATMDLIEAVLSGSSDRGVR